MQEGKKHQECLSLDRVLLILITNRKQNNAIKNKGIFLPSLSCIHLFFSSPLWLHFDKTPWKNKRPPAPLFPSIPHVVLPQCQLWVLLMQSSQRTSVASSINLLYALLLLTWQGNTTWCFNLSKWL